MWFFKKSEPTPPEESIELEKLMPILKELLDKSLSNFYSTCDETISSFNDYKEQFIKECHVLQNYDGEPIVEDMWTPNINSIKTQKISYTKTLARTLERNNEGEFDTKYGKYKAELLSIQEIISEMLRINSMFKIVVMAYSNQLSPFKKVFSNMEKSRDKLSEAIDLIQPEYKKYEEIRNKIENLYGMIDEEKLMAENIKNIEQEINELNTKDSISLKDKLTQMIDDRKTELLSVEEKIKDLNVHLSGNLLPIDRAARKMDYSYLGSKSLVSYLENPLENFKEDKDYSEFEKLLDDLIGLLQKDAIKIKDSSNVIVQISKLKSLDLKSKVTELKDLNERKQFLLNEIQNNERELNEKMSKAKILEQKKSDLIQIKDRIEQIKKSEQSLRENISSLFLNYYKRKIKVV
ncbi:MAG: hypothetical protein ACP5M9_03290 [Candidatus Micrarchaeia archaeon]